jgi:hypothetical protein
LKAWHKLGHLGLGERIKSRRTKMDIKKIWCGVVNWKEMAQGGGQELALVNTAMDHRIPQHVRKFFAG